MHKAIFGHSAPQSGVKVCIWRLTLFVLCSIMISAFIALAFIPIYTIKPTKAEHIAHPIASKIS